jgi:hypothetical protein
VTAVFDRFQQAEQAVQALRQQGVRDDHLSVVAQQTHGGAAAGGAAAGGASGGSGGTTTPTMRATVQPRASGGRGRRVAVRHRGGSDSGVGPLHHGGYAPDDGAGRGRRRRGCGRGCRRHHGAIAGALAKSGYDEHEASFYGSAVEQGGVLVAVNAVDGLSLTRSAPRSRSTARVTSRRSQTRPQVLEANIKQRLIERAAAVSVCAFTTDCSFRVALVWLRCLHPR